MAASARTNVSGSSTTVDDVSCPESRTGYPEIAKPAGGPEGPRTNSEALAATIVPLLGLMSKASRRILNDIHLSDDAIQETLLTFWSRVEPPENPRAWLLHAVTLRSLHLARTRRRRREHESRARIGRREWSVTDDPARSLENADLLADLNKSLTRLAPIYREVFALWAFDEMDYEGIAKVLQIPIGTVRSRLSRARQLIRDQLPSIIVSDSPPRSEFRKLSGDESGSRSKLTNRFDLARN